MNNTDTSLIYNLLAINGSTTSRGAQAFAFDEINRHMYALEAGAITCYPMDGGVGVSPISASLINGAAIGHQGLGIEYLPGKMKLWTTSAVVGRSACRFDYTPNVAIDTGEVYELFPTGTFANSTSCTPAVSTDGRYLLAHGTRFGTTRTFIRVFDIQQLVKGGPGNYTSQFLYEWETQQLVNPENPLQGQACDGTYVYLNAGGTGFDKTVNKRLHVYTLTGELIYRDDNCNVGREAALQDPRYTRYEPEGLSLIKGPNGKPVLTMGILSGDPGMRRFRIYQFTPAFHTYLDYRRSNKLIGIEDFTTRVDEQLAVPLNTKNQILLTDIDGQYITRTTVKACSIIETDEQLEMMKGRKESFGEIFNSWKRISRGGATYTDEFMPAEMDTWQYRPATDTIVNPINSASLIGFVSPDKFEDFTLDATVSSAGNDDDFIGVIIAHAVDPVTGETHILTAIRGGNGLAPLVIDKDCYGYNIRKYNVAKVLGDLTWCNGTLATYNGVNGGNGTWISAGIGCRLVVTRKGDLITVETSQFNSLVIWPKATTVFDLSADPELAIFRGPQSYGYCAVSQPLATWSVSQRPEMKLPIVDVRDWSIWEWINNTWVLKPSTKTDVITRGLVATDWTHQNETTGLMYYLDPTNQLYRL